MLNLTYLGVAGWHIQMGAASLLIDPYFTRLPMRRVLLSHAYPEPRAIARYTPPADWILVSHGHYDHLMDVPEAARLTGAQVFASPQSIELLELAGVDGSHLHAFAPGDVIDCGDLHVEIYLSRHRHIFGGIPYVGPLRAGLTPPLRARDYRIDFQVSFRITAGDIRLLIASGIDAEPPARADALLVGADATRRQLRPMLDAIRPQLVMPNHWDDMFCPLTQPPRPMHLPPSGRIPRLRRISLDEFAQAVADLTPDTSVLVPRIFEPMDLKQLFAE